MSPDSNLPERGGSRRVGRKIAAVAAAAVAVGASPASAQYGADAPLPALPPLQGVAAPQAGAPASSGTAAPGAPAATSPSPAVSNARAGSTAPGAGSGSPVAPASGLAGAVGSGDVVPAGGTHGAVRNIGVGAPAVRVVSSERAAPVALGGDNLPFTGARIGMLAAIGAALLALGLGVRRRSGLRAAKP